jgi:hypothetical protein
MIDTGTCAGPDTNLCHEYVVPHPPTLEKRVVNSESNFCKFVVEDLAL